jgi:hypothetical protein
LSERLVQGDESAASPSSSTGSASSIAASASAVASRVSKSASECKAKMGKEFKNLHTNLTKLSAKLDKVRRD